MSKGPGGKQAFLRDGWYINSEGIRVLQKMYEENSDGSQRQKGIQKVLKERGLWPTSGLNLSCLSPRCFDCQAAAKCKLCEKGSKCDICKAPKEHSVTPCTAQRRCDTCVLRQLQCTCKAKTYCEKCEGH